MKEYLSGDKQLSSFNKKSKSIIGVNSKKKPKSKQLFIYLYEWFKDEVIESYNKIRMLSDEDINQITTEIPESIMSEVQKEFVEHLLLSRKK